MGSGLGLAAPGEGRSSVGLRGQPVGLALEPRVKPKIF